jgi:TatD DNase family protein
VWGAFGCHPKSVRDFGPDKEIFLKNVMDHRKVVALGEIGLDYSQT